MPVRKYRHLNTKYVMLNTIQCQDSKSRGECNQLWANRDNTGAVWKVSRLCRQKGFTVELQIAAGVKDVSFRIFCDFDVRAKSLTVIAAWINVASEMRFSELHEEIERAREAAKEYESIEVLCSGGIWNKA